MKEKIKLRPGDSVLCYDGFTMMDITTVKSVDKVKGEATLTNGIICKRESKENNFKRTDYMSKTFEGFIKKLDKEAQALYNAWTFTKKFTREMESITEKIKVHFNLTLNEQRKLARGENAPLMEYIQVAMKLIDNLKKELL